MIMGVLVCAAYVMRLHCMHSSVIGCVCVLQIVHMKMCMLMYKCIKCMCYQWCVRYVPFV